MTALVLAAHSDSQGGSDWIWIVVVVVLVVLIAAGIFTVFTRSSRASRGGVEHPPEDKRRGNPPFESIERHP